MSSLLRKFVQWNARISKGLNNCFPRKFNESGAVAFVNDVVPCYLHAGQKIYDVGGGKRPFLKADRKSELKATVVGIDISEVELAAAKPGTYDDVLVSSIESVQGQSNGDLVICKTVLEHVEDTEKAFRAMHSLLKTGGHAAIVVPCRNALFARLNLMMPESLKRKFLFALYPDRQAVSGFPAYYDKCTPRSFELLAKQTGFEVVESRYFFWNSYVGCFVPLYCLWRLWSLLSYAVAGREACESFLFVLRRNS